MAWRHVCWSVITGGSLAACASLLAAQTTPAQATGSSAKLGDRVDKKNEVQKPKEKPPAATPGQALKIAKDFKAELLYSVPKDQQGSWVNLCVDPKGGLITSDQYGPLYRITMLPTTL